MKNKKIILFDIDHTLFDTDKFREIAYGKLAKKINVIFDEQFNKSALEAEGITTRAMNYFDPTFFLETIKNLYKSEISLNELKSEFWQKENFESSVYADVLPVLSNLKKIKDVHIGILSTGQNDHQRKKIEILKKMLTDEHVHIFIDKLSELKKVLEKYKDFQVFIVDNMPSVLDLSKAIDNQVKTVLIKRPVTWRGKKVENFKPNFEIKTLDALISIVLKS